MQIPCKMMPVKHIVSMGVIILPYPVIVFLGTFSNTPNRSLGFQNSTWNDTMMSSITTAAIEAMVLKGKNVNVIVIYPITDPNKELVNCSKYTFEISMLGRPTNLEPWIIPARLKPSYFSVSVKDVLFSLVAGPLVLLNFYAVLHIVCQILNCCLRCFNFIIQKKQQKEIVRNIITEHEYSSLKRLSSSRAFPMLLIMFSTVCYTFAACLCFLTEFENFTFSFSYFSQLFVEIT